MGNSATFRLNLRSPPADIPEVDTPEHGLKSEIISSYSSSQWNPHAPFVLDVAEFERALASAEAAERAADVNGARTAWEQAIALDGGDLLPSCDDEWIFPEREHLRQKLLHALESLTSEFLDGTRHVIYPWNQSKIENRKSSSPRIYPWGQSKI